MQAKYFNVTPNTQEQTLTEGLASQPLGITLGDPSGIGPEIVLKLHTQTLPAPCIVYGDAGVLRRTAERLHIAVDVCTLNDVASLPIRLPTPGKLFVLQTGHVLDSNLPIGQANAHSGQSAYDALTRAIDDALSGLIAGIVTAPLNKEALHMAGVEFPGHTEILAHRCGDLPVSMVLVNTHIRVILVTIHMPLAKVPLAINRDLELQTIKRAQTVCQQLGIAHPRIGVAGLNPHAGEAGRFGREEIETIEPAIAMARAEGIDATGPWPGDTVFYRAQRGEFDIVVAQYHDQGLIPIKYMGIDEGVNMTAGLPIVRTSVDHGTAFDIAGKGIAQADSLRCAFDLAYALTRHHPSVHQTLQTL